MNLFLAALWLVTAVALYVWLRIAPDHLPAWTISVFWLAVIMVIYNLFRWWSVRQLNRTRYTPPRLPPPRPFVRRDDDEPREGKNKFPPLTD